MSSVEHARQQRQLDRARTEDSLHQGAQRKMWADDGTLRTEYIAAMTNTDLQAGTRDRLSNLVTRDWVLGFLTDAEVIEARWLVIEMTLLELESMHPGKESAFTGDRRAALYDDAEEALDPLTATERQAIDKFLRGLFTRITRSRDGNQQEQFSKSVNVSEVRDSRKEKDGLFSGLIG